MTSLNLLGKYENISDFSEDRTSDKSLNISKLVIPFEIFFKQNTPRDIYLGLERIPFRERDLDYKIILKQEFILDEKSNKS
jgi:hypothetical protein